MASSTIFTIKRNDTKKAIDGILKSNAAVVNLTSCTVKFIMSLASKKNAVPKVKKSATIVDPLAGTVSYQWVTGDLDTKGTYDAEWEVTFLDGKVATFPDDGYLTVEVVADLG